MKDENEQEPKIDLDTILTDEIGQFGRFQLRICFLVAILTIFETWGTNEYVFTTARINTRCLIPECDNELPEWTPAWLSNAVPVTSQGSFDDCHRFGNTSSLAHLVENYTCPSTLFDTNTLQACDNYVYENTDSIVYEFELACNDWVRSLIGTFRNLGTFIGLPFVGYISDRWGRRVALCITAFNAAWLGAIRYFANSYIAFAVSAFAESVLAAGCYTCAYIMLLELVGPKYRVAAGASTKIFIALGAAFMGLIAWAIPYWRHLTLTLYIPQFLMVTYYWLMPESIRWYMSKGRFEESEALLKKVAKVNGKPLSDKSLSALRHNAEEEAKRKALEKYNADKDWLIATVFRHKRVLLRCILAPIWWVTTTFIYYGLSINAVNMSGNKYLNYVAVSLVEIPGFWMGIILMASIGRKIVLATTLWLCAACLIAYMFLPQGWYVLSLSMYLVAKFCIAIEAAALYVYTAELYPTVKRQTLFNFTSMVGRIGSMVAPLTPAFGAQWFDQLPFVLFASLAVLSGGLVLLTPETIGTKLPDTFEQAEALGRKNDNIKQL